MFLCFQNGVPTNAQREPSWSGPPLMESLRISVSRWDLSLVFLILIKISEGFLLTYFLFFSSGGVHPSE